MMTLHALVHGVPTDLPPDNSVNTMDSDDYFDGDEFDSAILNEVDRIVEAQLRPKQPPK